MQSKPLKKIPETAEGVGISVQYMNDVIERIEYLVSLAESLRPVAGNNIKISYTKDGYIISTI